ncbi:MAG: SDR family NAD(P)-dependent oxidoreductase, partial [Bacteroidota bacterium]
LMAAYPHLGPFMEGFISQVRGAYDDPKAPTNPMDVVRCFEKLIDMAPGSRPLRSIVGVDLGISAFQEVIEPVRVQFLKDMGLAEWDGPQPVKNNA